MLFTFPGSGKNSKKNEESKETNALTEEYQERLELLYDVAQQASSFSEVSKLLEEILLVIQELLRASASSLLLIDQERRELYVQAAGGTAANSLRQLRLNLDSGITGWVARNAKPLIVNNVAGDRRFNKDIDNTSGFITKSAIAAPLLRGQDIIGVIEILNKSDGTDFNKRDLSVLTGFAATEALILLVSMAVTAINNIKLHQAMLDGYKSTVEALVTAADAKDPYACGHSRRVCEYTMLAASSLKLPPEELRVIEFGALLHDIGKIGIDDSILRRARPLTDEEWYIIRKHPLRGSNIVGEIPFLQEAKDIVFSHHERYDGTGYPQGLKGETIPIGARLVAVADAFDTMTTDHSYRAALGADEAIHELIQGTGTQFCPVAVEAFISGFKKRKEGLDREIKAASAEKAGAETEVNEEVTKLSTEAAEYPTGESVRKAEETMKPEEAAALEQAVTELLAAEGAGGKTEAGADGTTVKLPQEDTENPASETAAKETAEVSEVEDTEEAAPEPDAELFEGEVPLAVQTPADFEQIKRFKESLRQVENLKIGMDSWSEDEGTVITVLAQKPMALRRIISGLPMVERVDRTDNNLLVVLTSSSISMD